MPDCSVSYTYHKKRETLTCHLCGSTLAAPEKCPSCGSDQIRYSGLGTERIESILSSYFKTARIARMDSDSMTRPQLYEKVLSDFGRGRIDILVGTQMIAKGLDFPQVTLVG
jgi:primosomal protein N' (replication factor Y)